MARVALAFSVPVGLLMAPAASAQQIAPFVATLSIIQGSAQFIPVSGGEAQPGIDGTNLSVGDRIVTGPASFAMATFLDGTTVTVSPLTDVVIATAAPTPNGRGFNIDMFINLGTLWGKVGSLLDQGSNVRFESNTGTATSNFGLPGARVNADGSFDCWTMAGEMSYGRADSPDRRALQAGEFDHIEVQRPPAQPFGHQSVVRIVSRGAFPLIKMPEDNRVLGFVAPGIEVNQAWPSVTSVEGDRYVLEVGGGFDGPFTLILEGERGGPFEVEISGYSGDRVVFEEVLIGSVAAGERLLSEVRHQIEPARPLRGLPPISPDRFAAPMVGGTVTPPEPFTDPLPGKFITSSGT